MTGFIGVYSTVKNTVWSMGIGFYFGSYVIFRKV